MALSIFIGFIVVHKVIKPNEKPIHHQGLCCKKGIELTFTTESNSKMGLLLIDVFSILFGVMIIDDYTDNLDGIYNFCSK